MRVNKGKGHAMHEGKRIVWALKMWVGEGWGKNLTQPLIYSIVQKGIQKPHIKSMETTIFPLDMCLF